VLTNLPKRAIEGRSSTKAAAFARRYMPAIPPFLLMESSYVLRTWNRSVSLIQTSPVQFEKEDSTRRRSHLLLSPCGAQLVRETDVCHNASMSPPRAAALRSRPDQPPMIMSVDQCLENVSDGVHDGANTPDRNSFAPESALNVSDPGSARPASPSLLVTASVAKQRHRETQARKRTKLVPRLFGMVI